MTIFIEVFRPIIKQRIHAGSSTARTLSEDLLPLKHYLENVYEGKQKVPEEPHEVLESFNQMVCVFFAGYISSLATAKKVPKA